MNWGLITSIFLLSTVKFMFAPFTGSGIGLSVAETFIASVSGGTLSSAIFYFASDFFMEYSQKKKIAKKLAALEKGIVFKEKKKFTKTNRAIIRVKRSLGIYGICFWAPFFLSVPIGSVIVAKFYGKLKQTYPLIVLGMLLNATITCFLAYFIF